MSPAREWKTEQEIRGIVVEEMRDALRGQNQLLEHVLHESRAGRTETREMLLEQNKIVDKLADAAQITLQKQIELQGDARLGVEGLIPKVLGRLTALEEGRSLDRDADRERDARLVRVEGKQDRTLRVVTEICKAWFVGANGKLEWTRVIPTVVATMTALHALLWPQQTIGQVVWVERWMHRLGWW